jgi:hypothetical protein
MVLIVPLFLCCYSNSIFSEADAAIPRAHFPGVNISIFILTSRNNCYTFKGKDLKLKKIILLLAVSFTAATLNAQTAKELIGKWKLASWTLKGKRWILSLHSRPMTFFKFSMKEMNLLV